MVRHKNAEPEKTKVCLFSTVQRPDDVRMFHREGKSLVKAGFDVHVVVPCQFSGRKDGMHFHPIRPTKSRLYRMIFLPWFAMWKALKTRSSIYHFHDPELLIVGFLMRWFLLRKVVFDMRESTSQQIMGKEYLPRWCRPIISFCYRVIEKVCLKGVAVIVANDKSVEGNEPCFLVRNFPELDEELMAGAMDMNERVKSPLLVYVGGVWQGRGAFEYIELARRLLERGHEIHMMIIGPYEEKFGLQLKSRVSELDLDGTVEIAGLMDYPKAMELASRATIGLSLLKPIADYTICLAGKIVEYMMCGTPVLASNFNHWRPYVEGERVGHMVDPCNMDDIVNVCEQMLNEPNELAAMGKRGMTAVRSKYNWSSEFQELLRCYEDLLASS